jgi:hypothetical protein
MGKCPVPPAQLALFIIVPAYTGVSDDEALEAMVMDRRWQLVLDCIDCEQAPERERNVRGVSTSLSGVGSSQGQSVEIYSRECPSRAE